MCSISDVMLEWACLIRVYICITMRTAGVLLDVVGGSDLGSDVLTQHFSKKHYIMCYLTTATINSGV